MKKSLLCLLLLLITALPAQARDNCFPGKEHTIVSPLQKPAVIWLESKNTEESHRLLYRIGEASQPKELFQFDREVCVYWSPEEEYVAITDYTASNIAETFIYKTQDVSHPVNVIDILPKKIQNYFGKGILHGYVETLSWTERGLFIRAFGDRESTPRTFDATLKCIIDVLTTRVMRHPWRYESCMRRFQTRRLSVTTR